jgi:hypothetical protein
MFYLWLLTGILGYASKIPFIGRIVTLLGIWYGKTTWWKMLLKLRKIFIMLNSLIGVYVVFKTVGFSSDNILAGFSAMGYEYLQILINASKRLFNWFFELFDHRIVPNIPGDKPNIPGSSGGIKTSLDYRYNPLLDKIPSKDSLRESYKSMFNITVQEQPTTSWYKNYSTWLWIGGILCTLGGLYLGYKFIMDPLFVDNINNSGTSTVKGSPVEPNGGQPDGSNPLFTIANGIGSITNSISNGLIKLNPYYWLLSDNSSQVQSFIDRQNNITTSDMRLYPFTKYNPHDSFLTKLRLSWLGETASELGNRMKAKSLALRELDILNTNINTIIDSPITRSPFLEGLTGFNSGFETPRLTNIGLGNKYVSGLGFLETLEASTSFNNTFNKISSLPPTPTNVPASLPEIDITVEEVKTVNPSWVDHTINQAELAEYKGPNKIIQASSRKVVEGLSFAEVAAKGIDNVNEIKNLENE